MNPTLITAALLLGGLLPLVAGPFLAEQARRSEGTKLALDAFVAVSLGGIVLLHLWPHAFLVAGSWALVGGLAGLLLPFLLHGSLHNHEHKIYPGMLVLAFLGMAIHAALDGVALLSPVIADTTTLDAAAHDAAAHEGHNHAGHHDGHDHHDEHDPVPQETVSQELVSQDTTAHDYAATHDHHGHATESAALLAAAVILHRLPMGIAVWWLTAPILGRRGAISLLAILAGATVIGFGLAERVFAALSLPGVALFEATIAGMLLHVVMGHEHAHSDEHDHQHHTHQHPHQHSHQHDNQPPQEDRPWISAMGALAGGLLVAALNYVHPMDQRYANALSFGESVTALAFYLAPFLVLGLVLAVSRRLLPPPWNGQLGGLARSELSLPAGLISLALLGWQWTLLYILGLLWVLAAVRLAGASGAPQTSPVAGISWRRTLTLCERVGHRNSVWLLVAILTVALLEPLVRLELSNLWLSLVAAVVLGILCDRAPILGILLAFLLLHMDWPPVAVLVFLFSGALARVQRAAPFKPRPPARALAFAALGLVPMALGARVVPATAAVDFHALATAPSLFQTAAVAMVVVLLAVSLLKRGFRAFLFPVFGHAAEPHAD